MKGSNSYLEEDEQAACAPLHFDRVEIRGKHIIADNEILHELKGHRQQYDEPDGGSYAPALV
mgnify:CR=1 FL=1